MRGGCRIVSDSRPVSSEAGKRPGWKRARDTSRSNMNRHSERTFG
ncbi:hypothetical protein AB434_2827 [Heyndrickxia coagulans]|uniref:Uncharacterized protein n=1 Tax=Heyndrickxia coagulans TaxID=1398 RepID=A0AAN0T5P3_HEYCO|nr:hypothetical protein SB48_HM08orf03931 [Heyndrickxia coagulans]AKN55232.1 hypothetical protein AB434_2827 [Heyndrickxia coagulans]KYC59161.1 hypothetical protein B4100_3662 [Heyndrickxia coagulans]KYC89731.1 hypothetical protein B4096_3673 [Heyndrickxia coagulans]